MARIVKEYAVRRNEILDVAQRLIYTKGYEQMAIQDILDELQIAKGTFYHYFDSKQALLEALLERLRQEVEQLLMPIISDTHLSAREKFQSFFDTIGRWKTTKKDFLLGLLRVWYTDDNALVRQKWLTKMTQLVSVLFTTIIQQGIQEGCMQSSYPEQVGRVVVSLMYDLSNAFGNLLLSHEPQWDVLQTAELIVAAYTEAIERILGMTKGSLCLIEPETLKFWLLTT